jgi:acetolactate synthase-1/3 small subunit
VPSQRHIIAITLQNESGALTRVAGLFSTRGYNIESLNVAATDDPTVSRLTLVTTGNDAVIHQITQQSLKLVDVVDVEDVTREEHFERELLLIKVKAKATQVGSLWSATQRAGGRVLWDAADSFTSNSRAAKSTSTFMAEVANFGEVLEVVQRHSRSRRVGTSRIVRPLRASRSSVFVVARGKIPARSHGGTYGQ